MRAPAIHIHLRQETKYPDESRTRLVFACDKPTEINLKVRHPWWATAGFDIRVNGQKQTIASNQPSSYVEVSRIWKTGDAMEISMPFTLRTEGFRDNPNRVAVMYGPLVLCAEVSSPVVGLPLSANQFVSALKAVVSEPNTFAPAPGAVPISSAATDSSLKLEPFHKMQGSRKYQVYWDVTPASNARNADL
jgi:uncharacterized protein